MIFLNSLLHVFPTKHKQNKLIHTHGGLSDNVSEFFDKSGGIFVLNLLF